jgi:hypothetical protein
LLFPSSPFSSTMCMVVPMPLLDELAYIDVDFRTEFIRRRIS